MTGSKYARYYKPLVGHLLVLPYPDKVHNILMAGKINEMGDLKGVDVPIYQNDLSKGVVVEKGMDNPTSEFPSMIKRRDVVLYPRGAGRKVTLKTQSEDGGYSDREFIIISELEIVAVV